MKKLLKFKQYNINENSTSEENIINDIVRQSVESLSFLATSGYNLKGNELIEKINSALNSIWQQSSGNEIKQNILETRRQELVSQIEQEFLTSQ